MEFPWLVRRCLLCVIRCSLCRLPQSEDFSESEDEEDQGKVVFTVERGELSDEKMIKRLKGKRQRSEKLVQERVISVSGFAVCGPFSL